MSRYYPGFVAAFFIVLLRVAIGWHFLYEGCEKVESMYYGKDPFSAEIYLRNATGPLGSYFRGMLPDVNSLATLDPVRLKASWKDDVSRITDHYNFTSEQRDKAQKILDGSLQWADYWFDDPANQEQRQKYYHDLGQVLATDQDPQTLSFEKERAWDARRSVESDRRSLIQPLVAQGLALRDAVAKVAPPEQRESADARGKAMFDWLAQKNINIPISIQSKVTGLTAWTLLDFLNWMTIISLIAIGFCMIAGFLTPIAAISAAGFLAMIYLSMPPWPGTPPNPRAEGHYLIVSKNLVELLACLVIATTPSGHWVGLDALFFGARRRRRLARNLANAETHAGRRQPIRVG
jgi:uncharacterized membrane protein YphA (DoxX/SURF4 family)